MVNTYKSARVVGDVMGNYHPHGDLRFMKPVRMARDAYAVALVDGQEFWIVDGDPAAAIRADQVGSSS